MSRTAEYSMQVRQIAQEVQMDHGDEEVDWSDLADAVIGSLVPTPPLSDFPAIEEMCKTAVA